MAIVQQITTIEQRKNRTKNKWEKFMHEGVNLNSTVMKYWLMVFTWHAEWGSRESFAVVYLTLASIDIVKGIKHS